MPDATIVIREAEGRAAAEFLASARGSPAALLVEGEAGIGKTSLCSAVLRDAGEAGFRVLFARPAPAESVLAYGSVADLLRRVDGTSFAALPHLQRHAVDKVMLRADADDEATDQRAVAAAFLSVVETLAAKSPVLLAVDDLQWLDPSSARVIGFATRRLSGPVGVLATLRDDRPDGVCPLQLPDPDAVTRIRLQPLTVGALHVVVSQRLGRSLPRPTMVRIHEISGGNPLYGLELARAVVAGTTDIESALPSTLTELVQDRIGSLGGDVQEMLLAAACASAPTVELLAGATGTTATDVVRLLEPAEEKGIVGIDGNKVYFSHPLLARGVYTGARPALRRDIHRRLADVVEETEPAARHLAMAATTGDPATLRRLDEAADIARARGAPAAAAELVELAMRLGGDTPQRQIRSANHYVDAGDPGRARTMLDKAMAVVKSGPLMAAALFLLALVCLSDDSFVDAANLLERGLDEVGDELSLQGKILVTLAFVRINVGRFADAMESVEQAVAVAEQLGDQQLLSHALGLRVTVGMFLGDGIDESTLRRALTLEDPDAAVPLFFRASTQNALVSAWSGQFDRARDEMASVKQRCAERGEEKELAFLAFHSALIEVWRGDFPAATRIAEETMERAHQLGGDQALFTALTIQACLAACAGRVADARRDTAEAFAAGLRSNATTRMEWPVTTLGFLEVSLGNHAAALETLQPLLSRFKEAPGSTEIMVADFIPDAIEALIALGRLTTAEPLIEHLERNGRKLDRPWMLANGARCRAMLLAGQGDLSGAAATARQAMEHHERLPMPLERARTQLLLGQIQRRQRQKGAATQNLDEALAAFEAMGIPLWAERVRAELARCAVVPRRPSGLSPTEQRVAALAADGMTNRDIAAALFISAKTVEANLARVYRKLGIHSRAELGSHMSRAGRHDDT